MSNTALAVNQAAPYPANWDWKADPEFVEELGQDLRKKAIAQLRSGIRAISASSLVQESLVRLLRAGCLKKPTDRGYVYTLAASIMRKVVVDHVRAATAQKRGGNNRFVSDHDFVVTAIEKDDIDILALHEALEELTRRNPRQAQVVDLKFFYGCGMPEIANHLGFGLSTIEKDWTEAKLWLFAFLSQ